MFHITRKVFKRELLAGLTTFFTLAYIVIVAPNMYHNAGANFDHAFVAVCLVSAVSTLLVGCFANLPIAMAPGLGLMSYFCYEVIAQLHFTWNQALAAVFVAGLAFFVITVTNIRRLILNAIPHSLGLAVASGIGFFIGFIALKSVGVIVPNVQTIITLGSLAHVPVLLFFLGFALIAILDGYNVPGAILIGMLIVTILGNLLGLNHFHHLFQLPHFDGHYFNHFDFRPLWTSHGLPVLFAFLIIALFDSTGTLLGLTKLLHFKDPQEEKRRINQALLAESITTAGAAMVGTSTLSPFLESAAGISSGGRTGLTAVVVACGFILLLFFAPLASSIPSFATASALFYVACLMIKPFAGVKWDDMSELIPAVVVLLIIPLSFSIADGVGIGLICYVVLKGAKREWRQIHPMLWILALIFLIYFSL